MNEFPEWKIALAEGIKNVKTCGWCAQNARVQTPDKDTGVDILGVIKQNMKLIPPGYYDKITGTAANCRDFTIHFGDKDRSNEFVRSIEQIQKEYGDYVNGRGEYAVSQTESGKDSKDSKDGDTPNGTIVIVLVVFAAAIAYYLWKQTR